MIQREQCDEAEAENGARFVEKIDFGVGDDRNVEEYDNGVDLVRSPIAVP